MGKLLNVDPVTVKTMYNRRAAVHRQGKSSHSHGSVTQVFLNIHVLRLIPKLISHRLDWSPHRDGLHIALHKTQVFFRPALIQSGPGCDFPGRYVTEFHLD